MADGNEFQGIRPFQGPDLGDVRERVEKY